MRSAALDDALATVAPIVADVRERGDAALIEWTERLDGNRDGGIRVDAARIAAADVADDVLDALRQMIAAVRTFNEAQRPADTSVEAAPGIVSERRWVPLAAVGVCVPSGRTPLPSSLVMTAVPALVAGVGRVAVVTPNPADATLVVARELGIEEVWAIGGAQAVAALAYGTESIPRVDVIVGPGSLWVQEAKREVAHVVGIDGFAGPSDLTVIASAGADVEALRLDLQAQAEHGEGSLTVAVSDDAGILEQLEATSRVLADDMEAALALAEALAPEHLQLAGEAAEALAPRVRSAGCLFVGNASGTAFGDYVAGSNHTLPTEGAARFASGLNVRHFRRRMAEVRLHDAAPALAAAGVPIAEAEGFAAHAASMSLRQNR